MTDEPVGRTGGNRSCDASDPLGPQGGRRGHGSAAAASAPSRRALPPAPATGPSGPRGARPPPPDARSSRTASAPPAAAPGPRRPSRPVPPGAILAGAGPPCRSVGWETVRGATIWRHRDQKLPGSTSIRNRHAARSRSTHPASASPSNSPSSIPAARIRRRCQSVRLLSGRTSGPTASPAAATCSRHVCTQGPASHARARTHLQLVLWLQETTAAIPQCVHRPAQVLLDRKVTGGRWVSAKWYQAVRQHREPDAALPARVAHQLHRHVGSCAVPQGHRPHPLIMQPQRCGPTQRARLKAPAPSGLPPPP